MIGIGGISMSGLAEILLHWGYKVTGSDLKSSETTKKLEESGIKVYTPHKASNVEGADAVIYTAAIKNDNPEFIRAQELGLLIVDRATLLGEITRKYENSIAISGTHGKTTTTSMIATTFVEAQLDPTILVGGEIESLGGNYKIGSSQYLITEACEYVESFLKFHPFIEVVLNIEEDHLDYFKNLEHIKSSFLKFTEKLTNNGMLVGNFDDVNVQDVFSESSKKYISFALNNPAADWTAKNIKFNSMGCPSFEVHYRKEIKGSIQLMIPGTHNIYNSLACIAACSYLGVQFETIKTSLENFTGAKRRFQFKGTFNGITVIDDYAHHPSEVKSTLQAALGRTHRSLYCIFQPHTYTRTKALLSDFAKAFENADNVIILDIYAAREANTGQIHSKDLVEAINKFSNNAIYANDFNHAIEIISTQAQPGDLVLTMGAGDVYKIGEILVETKKDTA